MPLRMVLAQRLGGLADLALARQEDQHVAARRVRAQLVHGVDDRLLQVLLVLVFVLATERPVAHFTGYSAARHLDHRRACPPENAARSARRRWWPR